VSPTLASVAESVEEHTLRTIADSELAPESGQVYFDWLARHDL